MKQDDREFLHALTNKLAKIDGFTGMLKSTIGEDNLHLIKIEKANNEALELIKNYRALLESREPS